MLGVSLGRRASLGVERCNSSVGGILRRLGLGCGFAGKLLAMRQHLAQLRWGQCCFPGGMRRHELRVDLSDTDLQSRNDVWSVLEELHLGQRLCPLGAQSVQAVGLRQDRVWLRRGGD